jgi:predicted metalloprotease
VQLHGTYSRFVRSRFFASLVIAGLALSACGAPEPGVAATRSRQIDDGKLIPDNPDDPDDPNDPKIDVVPGVIDFGSNKPPQDHDAFITVAVKDVVQFMEEIYPQLYGEPFPPLEGGVFAAYPERPDDEPIPGCGTPTSTYDDVAGAGAFYCSLGDFVAYDDPFLATLVAELGLSGVGIVMAHEFGHSIQFRQNEFDQPTILMEQQADCFAGAWAARVARGESEQLQFDDNDVKAGLIAMIQVRDPTGTSLDDPNAHGTGFDRVGAFQDGFTNGAEACKPYFEQPPTLVDVQLDPFDENEGNLPYVDESGNGGDIVTQVPLDLDSFWTELFTSQSLGTFSPPTLVRFADGETPPACDGLDASQLEDNVVYCAATNSVILSDRRAVELAEIPAAGDMSIGYLISTAYSESVLDQLGISLEGEERSLATDCLSGLWTADTLPQNRAADEFRLSAGDLDEAIVTAIAVSDSTSDTNERGSAFEKTAAYRRGVIDALGGASADLVQGCSSS